jgi:hypothetical protein
MSGVGGLSGPGAVGLGQVPSLAPGVTQPLAGACRVDDQHHWQGSGLAARWLAIGTLAVHSGPCQFWVHWAAVSMTSGVSRKKVQCACLAAPQASLPRIPCSNCPSIMRWCWPLSFWAAALNAASNSALLRAVEPLTGNCSTNSPSCGTHSSLHTSQLALQLDFQLGFIGEGLKSGVMVSGTGSSTLFS